MESMTRAALQVWPTLTSLLCHLLTLFGLLRPLSATGCASTYLTDSYTCS